MWIFSLYCPGTIHPTSGLPTATYLLLLGDTELATQPGQCVTSLIPWPVTPPKQANIHAKHVRPALVGASAGVVYQAAILVDLRHMICDMTSVSGRKK